MSFLDRTLRLLDEVDRVSSSYRLNEGSGNSPSLIGMHKPMRIFKEKDTEYVLTVDMPGVRKEDVQIEMTNDSSINIKATRELHEYDFILQNLPKDVDTNQLSATLEHGVLDVRLGKKEAIRTTIPISVH